MDSPSSGAITRPSPSDAEQYPEATQDFATSAISETEATEATEGTESSERIKAAARAASPVPSGPTESSALTGPTEHFKITEPSEPTESPEISTATGRNGPSEQEAAEPSTPVGATDPSGPAEPSRRTESSGLTGSTWAASENEPSEPAEPSGPGAPPALARIADSAPRRGRSALAHRTTLMAVAVVVAVGLAFAVGVLVGRGGGGDRSAAEPLTASGPIGPWQHYGHASSEKESFERVAADPGGVLLIGDSVAARIRGDLNQALREQRRPMSWDHWNGRPTHGAADMLVALDAAGHQPATLVVVSGENDIFEPYLFATQVERVMRTAGPARQVHWIVPMVSRRASSEPDLANSARLAEMLVASAARHPNLHLVQWRDHLARADEETRRRLMPDGVHPSPEGSAEMARLIMGSLEASPAR